LGFGSYFTGLLSVDKSIVMLPLGLLLVATRANRTQSMRHPPATALYVMLVVSEFHPFTDGNGRVARVMKVGRRPTPRIRAKGTVSDLVAEQRQ